MKTFDRPASATRPQASGSWLGNKAAAQRALQRALPGIECQVADPEVCGSGFLHIVIMDPALGPGDAGFDEAILEEHSVGDRSRWDADYAAFAREGFMGNAIVYRCVRMVAETAASVPLLLYRGEEEIESHALSELVNRPNQAQVGPEFLETLACPDQLCDARIDPLALLGKHLPLLGVRGAVVEARQHVGDPPAG